jgi:hypothetical protein
MHRGTDANEIGLEPVIAGRPVPGAGSGTPAVLGLEASASDAELIELFACEQRARVSAIDPGLERTRRKLRSRRIGHWLAARASGEGSHT